MKDTVSTFLDNTEDAFGGLGYDGMSFDAVRGVLDANNSKEAQNILDGFMTEFMGRNGSRGDN